MSIVPAILLCLRIGSGAVLRVHDESRVGNGVRHSTEADGAHCKGANMPKAVEVMCEALLGDEFEFRGEGDLLPHVAVEPSQRAQAGMMLLITRRKLSGLSNEPRDQ